MESAIHEITEREILGGVLTAVIALAEKLTGERLTVYLRNFGSTARDQTWAS